MMDIHQYEDIIELDYAKSKNRPHMTMTDRAAQFAPFAALTGHKEKIIESGRYVETEIILSENELDLINRKYQLLMELANSEPIITVQYFKKDKLKNGGEYISKTGVFKKIDEYEKVLIFDDKVEIELKNIVNISGDIFGEMD